MVVDLLDNAVLQGLAYACAVLGVAIAFRVLRYPDLTADGSFLLGSTVFVALLTAGWHWTAAMAGAILAGGAAGALTALLNAGGVSRLLSGILTSMMCYSVAFRVLADRPNVGTADFATLFTGAENIDRALGTSRLGLHPVALCISAGTAGLVLLAVILLLRSDFGLILRTTGANEALVEDLGRRPALYRFFGLLIANSLVALSGTLVVARQGFADINMGIGVIITFVAALVLGEELMRRLGVDPARHLASRVLSAVMGAIVYFLCYLLILRASIRGWLPIQIKPTDLKMLSAVFVVIVYLLRRRSLRPDTEILPL